jgi:hypothetical protein
MYFVSIHPPIDSQAYIQKITISIPFPTTILSSFSVKYKKKGVSLISHFGISRITLQLYHTKIKILV